MYDGKTAETLLHLLLKNFIRGIITKYQMIDAEVRRIFTMFGYTYIQVCTKNHLTHMEQSTYRSRARRKSGVVERGENGQEEF